MKKALYSRRDFIKTTAIGGLGLAAGLEAVPKEHGGLRRVPSLSSISSLLVGPMRIRVLT